MRLCTLVRGVERACEIEVEEGGRDCDMAGDGRIEALIQELKTTAFNYLSYPTLPCIVLSQHWQ